MKKNNSSANYKVFIVPAILFVIFMMGVVLLLKWAIHGLNDSSDTVQEKLVELDIERDKVGELPEIKEQFLKVNMHKDELDVLFSEEDVVELVQKIEKMAEETRNTISISVDEAGAKKTKTKKDKESKEENKLLEGFSEDEYFKINIDVMGDYVGLLNFIDKFNNLDYYNSLVSFDIISQEEERKEEHRLIDAESGRTNANASSGDNVEEHKTKLFLKSKLGVVFYLGKAINEQSDNNNGS